MRHIFCVALLLGMVSVPLSAQLDRGTVTGVITDPSGAVIPGVQISIRNTATSAAYRSSSNETGQYTVPNLPVGDYQMVFEATGFKKLIRSGVTVGVGAVLRVDVPLQLGPTADSIEVTAEVPRLQTETPEVGTTLSNKPLLDLPLTFASGRRPEAFAYVVTPGVQGTTDQSHINGSTSYSKEMLVDGASVTVNQSGDYNAAAISLEAIQEFRVQTSGVPAEYGRTQAGVFNFVMKSGSNQLHGSAYGALRNEALNANTFTNNALGMQRAPDRKQNYAFSFGGPFSIPKVYSGRDHTFFYSSYERYKERSYGLTPNKTVPLPEFYDGDLSRLLDRTKMITDSQKNSYYRGAIFDPLTFSLLPGGAYTATQFPGNKIPMGRFSEVSRRVNAIAKAHYLPTIRDASGQIPLSNNALFPLATRPEWDMYQVSTKVDHIFNDKHKLSAAYNQRYAPYLILDQNGMWDVSDPTGGPLARARTRGDTGELARLTEDWTISPRVLNHFTASYNRRGNPQHIIYGDVDGAKELGIKNLSTRGYPTLNWGSGPNMTLTPAGYMNDSFRADVSCGLMDTVSFSKGRHFLKAGADMRRYQLNSTGAERVQFSFSPQATSIPLESFSTSSLAGHAFASYLLGIVNNVTVNDYPGSGGRRHYYALFLQDDFKAGKHLTLNFGLRWEYQPPGVEVADRMSSWNPNKTDPASGLSGAYDFAGHCNVCTGKRSFGRRSLRDFGPRFGFAWHPLQKWTVRGSYGIFYEGDSFNEYDATPFGPVSTVAANATSTAWVGSWKLSQKAVSSWEGVIPNWDNGFPLDKYQPPQFDVSWGNSNIPGMVDPNYGQTPYIQSWNFHLQREIARKLVLEAGYVGSKGTRLRAGQLQRLNQLPVSVLQQHKADLGKPVASLDDAAKYNIKYPYRGFNGTVASALRPYPQVNGTSSVVVYGSPLGFSTYHALQVVASREVHNGLTAYASYVWSKTLSNVDSSFLYDTSGGGDTDRPLDYYNLKLEKAVAGYDIPHAFKAYVSWDVPVGRSKALLGNSGRLTNAILGGWSVAGILNYFSGTPLGPWSTPALASNIWNGAVNRPNVAAGEMINPSFDASRYEASTPTSPNNTYLVTSLFAQPPAYTLGTGARRYSQARNPRTRNEDLSIQKRHNLTEKLRLRLRAELLNAFNRHTLEKIGTNLNSTTFGQVTGVSGYRQVQVSVRLDF
jgi:hypothetical protein